MEHGLKDIAFYVQKHITHPTVVITSLLVRDKPLEAPASVKRVYSSNRGISYFASEVFLVTFIFHKCHQTQAVSTEIEHLSNIDVIFNTQT